MALIGNDLIRKYLSMQKKILLCLYTIFWGKSPVWNWTWKCVTLSQERYMLYLKKMLQSMRIIVLLKNLISNWLLICL